MHSRIMNLLTRDAYAHIDRTGFRSRIHRRSEEAVPKPKFVYFLCRKFSAVHPYQDVCVGNASELELYDTLDVNRFRSKEAAGFDIFDEFVQFQLEDAVDDIWSCLPGFPIDSVDYLWP